MENIVILKTTGLEEIYGIPRNGFRERIQWPAGLVVPIGLFIVVNRPPHVVPIYCDRHSKA